MQLVVEGVPLHFASRGTGPAIVLLHAFPLSSSMWEEQERALGDRYRVVLIDARGFGGSGLGDVPISMARLAEDAVAVMDHLGIGRAVIGGCSMGGYAALAFARSFASRLAGLALIDTKAAPDTDEARGGRASLAAKVLAEGPSAAADAMLPKLLGDTSRRARPELVMRVRRLILEASPQGIAGALAALAERPDSAPTLAHIDVPTLIVRGEEDAVISLQDAELLHRGIAGSRLVSLSRAGHLPSLETPEALSEALADLLEKTKRGEHA